MSEQITAAIRGTIEDHGPISFAEFMEIALYGPGGFYEEPPVGEEGHFVTSPQVHGVFGALLAQGLRKMWAAMGRPRPFHVIELGAGDGALARQLVSGLAGVPVNYVGVDRSPGARARMAKARVRAAPSIEMVGRGLTGCVLANELFDNLPFRWFRRTTEGLQEVCVGLDRDRLVKVEVSRPEGFLEDVPELTLRPGEEAAVSLDALNLLYRVARTLGAGYALVIDYGSRPGQPRGEVHGYRRHRVVQDVLEEPGTADVTTGVDFGLLVRRAESLGLATLGPVSQRAALVALGFRKWAEGERRRQAEALDRREGREAVLTWSERNRAVLLIDPAGLGRLEWLALSTPGMPWPAWLEDALRLDEEGLPEADKADAAVMEAAEESLAREPELRSLPVDVADDEEDAPHDGDEVR